MFHSIKPRHGSKLQASLPIDTDNKHTFQTTILSLQQHTDSHPPTPNPQPWQANNQSTLISDLIPNKSIPANTQSPWHNNNNNNNNRSKNPAASRTPQNRSNTASPAPSLSQQQQPQQNNHTQASKPPPANVWAQRATTQSRDSSNGPAPQPQQQQQRQQSPATVVPGAVGFNAAEVKGFLARDAMEAGGEVYKVQEGGAGGVKGIGGGGGGAAKGENKSEYLR
jgi:hypothetical protein